MSSDDEKIASLVPSSSHALTHRGSAGLAQRGMQDLLAAEAEQLKGLEIESKQQQDAGRARGTTPPDELKEFEHETERARQIATSHPRFWEYLLTEELMRSKIFDIEQKYDEFDKGLLFKPRRPMSPLQFFKWMPDKMQEVGAICQSIPLDLLNVAWGKPEQPGNALQILQAVNKIIDSCTALLDWELEVASIELPVALRALPATLRGSTTGFISEIKHFADQISKATQDTGSTRRVEVKLTLVAPPQCARFQAQWEACWKGFRDDS